MFGRKNAQSILAAAAVFLVLLFLTTATGAAAATDVQTELDRTADYLLALEKAQGTPLSPWSYVALACAGKDLAGTKVLQLCVEELETLESGDLNDYCILVLTLLAAGENPYNYQGRNLVQMIRDSQLPSGKFADSIDRSGFCDRGEQLLANAHIWALLALHAAGSGIPDAPKAGQWLVETQHPNGSFNWNLADQKPDVDSTGAALMALGVLGETRESPVVRKALEYLQSAQENDGGFSSWGAANPESCAMVILGLLAVEVDPGEKEWTRPGGNPVEAMLSYQLPDGSFEHIKGMGSNLMATEQALLALSALHSGHNPVDLLKKAATGSSKDSFPEREIRFKPGEAGYVVGIRGQKQFLEADAVPFLRDGRTFVPVRYLALALGVPEGNINWPPASQKVTLANYSGTVSLTVGSNILDNGGRPVKMDVEPLLLPPGRVYLPARYVAEAFGYLVNWDEQEQAVVISR